MIKQFQAIVTGAAVIAGLTIYAADLPYKLKPNNQLEVNSVLASVNGEPISLWDVLPATRQQEYQAYAAYSGNRLYEAIRQIRQKMVDNLIDRKLILADYRNMTFKISDQDIETELDNIAEQMGYNSRNEFISNARKNGSSLEEIRKNVTDKLIVQLMIFHKTQMAENVTPKEIYEYYQTHSEEFTKPETIELGLLLLTPDRSDLETVIAKISQELDKDPESFTALTKQYSSGPEADNGGNLGLIERNRLRPEFAKAISSSEQKGQVYGPIRTEDGIFFLKILNLNPAESGKLQQLMPEIRNRLEQERKDKVKEEYIKQLRRNAIIRYFF